MTKTQARCIQRAAAAQPMRQAQAGLGSYHHYAVNGLGAFDSSLWSLLSIAGGAAGAYHGYKRNRESIGWAIGWGLLGSMFPVITVPIAVAQGFGKAK